MGLPLARTRSVAQVAPADPQVPAVRLPLLAARQRAQPRQVSLLSENHQQWQCVLLHSAVSSEWLDLMNNLQGVWRPASELTVRVFGQRRRERRLRSLPRKTLQRCCRRFVIQTQKYYGKIYEAKSLLFPGNVGAVCGHELCVKCALDLCSVIKSYDVPGIAGSIPCPLCRSGIASFRRRAASEEPDNPDLNAAYGKRSSSSSSDGRRSASSPEKKDSDQAILPLYCAPFAPPVVLT